VHRNNQGEACTDPSLFHSHIIDAMTIKFGSPKAAKACTQDMLALSLSYRTVSVLYCKWEALISYDFTFASSFYLVSFVLLLGLLLIRLFSICYCYFALRVFICVFVRNRYRTYTKKEKDTGRGERRNPIMELQVHLVNLKYGSWEINAIMVLYFCYSCMIKSQHC